MYYWTYAVESTHVMMFEDIIDWHILVNYNSFFRVERDSRVNRQQVDLGGFGAESLWKRTKGISSIASIIAVVFVVNWVFGLVEKVSGKCWLKIVHRRDAPTLGRLLLTSYLERLK